MELSPEQRATLLSLAQSARAQLETELELGLNGLSAPVTARPVAVPRRPAAPAAVAPAAPAPQASQPEPAPIASQQRLQILQTLQAEAAQCTGCVLHEKRTKSVFARGTPDAELVFVGEGPGRDEDLQGLPFVGAAGQLLDRMITAMGYGRDDVYICNVVKCRPPENRTPRPEEALACSRFLIPQLQAVSPKVIVALGRCAAQALGVAEAMGSWRGRWGTF
jgi:DNA polymerase